MMSVVLLSRFVRLLGLNRAAMPNSLILGKAIKYPFGYRDGRFKLIVASASRSQLSVSADAVVASIELADT
jgi:hypothetical protein